MSTNSYPKIGLALGSGGAKGLAHIGVLKVFEAHDIPISYVAGASIGALLGAYYCAHPQIDKLEQLALSFNKRMSFSLFDPSLRGGLIKGKKVEKFISDMLEGATFNSLEIPFAAIATDFTNGEEIVYTKGDLVRVIRASISAPGFFQPIWYQNKLLADGGLSDPVPNEVVKNMGADLIVAVNLESGYFDKVLEKRPSIAAVPLRSVNILRHNLVLQSMKTADLIISPYVSKVGYMGWNHFFDSNKAQTIIKIGEEAAEAAIPKLKEVIIQKKKEKGLRKFYYFFKNYLTK